MSDFNLKSIDIKSFRGIKNYHLDFNSKSLVIVGENGCGKSSIVNAFEFLFTGKVDSLSGKQAIRHDKSLIHIGDKPEDLLVKATVEDEEIERTLQSEPESSTVVDDFKNGSFLLNRQKLLNFIDQTPKGKYDSINTLIGFDELDDVEKILLKTQKTFKNRLKIKEDEAERKLKSICTDLNCSEDEIYEKISENVEIDENTDLKEVLKNIEKSKSSDADFDELENEYSKLRESYRKLSLNTLKSSNLLIDILNSSQTYLENTKESICPVCSQEIKNSSVIENIKRRHDELKENENTLKTWKNDLHTLISKLNNINYSIENPQLSEFINDLNLLLSFDITPEDIESPLNTLKELYKPDDSVDIYDIILNLSELKTLKSEMETLEKEFEIADKTYDIFRQRKQKALENVIDKIEKKVSHYYNFIHDHEEFNTPQLDVPKSTGISLNLNFKDVIADPRSYSSEGHLDSLGLCIFLAFAKEFNTHKFLILDDIISTVDLNHKQRVAMLLLNEFKDYQIILTTHNKLWFRQLKNYVRANDMGSEYVFAEIRNLDHATGPNLTKNMYSEELIDKYLELGDAYAAGNAIRRYLEHVLETVCKVNSIPLPLKSYYTVDDYFKELNRFFIKSDLFKTAPKSRKYYEKIFKRLDHARDLGNQLSHDDETSLDVTLNEVENYKKTVFDFKRSMTCWKDNYYLKFNKNSKSAQCTKNKCIVIMSFKNKN